MANESVKSALGSPIYLMEGSVSATVLNLRSAPSALASVFTTLTQGDKVTILGESPSWYHVKSGRYEKNGYVAKKYIDVELDNTGSAHDDTNAYKADSLATTKAQDKIAGGVILGGLALIGAAFYGYTRYHKEVEEKRQVSDVWRKHKEIARAHLAKAEVKAEVIKAHRPLQPHSSYNEDQKRRWYANEAKLIREERDRFLAASDSAKTSGDYGGYGQALAGGSGNSRRQAVDARGNLITEAE